MACSIRALGLAALLLCLAITVSADTPTMMNYQGSLASNGEPVADDTYTMQFRIYDDIGTELWLEEHLVQTTGGIFNVLLGSNGNPISPDLFSGSERYLGITVGSDPEISPRTPLVSVSYAFRADAADSAQTVADGSVTAVKIAPSAVGSSELAGDAVTSTQILDASISFADIGQNGAAAGQVIKWNGSAWEAADDNVGGGGGGWADDGSIVRLETGTDSVGIGTATPTEKLEVDGNIKATGTIQSGNSIIIDGVNDKITASGGAIDFEDEDIITTGKATFGPSHTNTGSNAFVAGESNTASGDRASVAGGFSNSATGGRSAVSGGQNNQATGDWATVGGGANNSAVSQATVAGGNGNSASGSASSVLGGAGNQAVGSYSSVGGGGANKVDGQYSAIPGGYADTIAATASYSYLFGIGSKLTQDSTFMVDLPHIRFGDESTGYEFPPSDGSASQVLQTDGAGQLSWSTVSGGGGGGWTDDGSVVRLDTDTDSVGIGTSTPSAKLDIAGDMIVSGKATIGPSNTNTSAYGFVAGDSNIVSGDYATVGGGRNNYARGHYSVIAGGGYSNSLADSNSANGDYSFIGSGRGNYIGSSALGAVIGGGVLNTAAAGYNVVGGGSGNTASGGSSVIGGGINNTASGASSVIGGGYLNSASDGYSVVSGGLENSASGWRSVIGGGQSNSASGGFGVVSGGVDNTASGVLSTVAGGNTNIASGTKSTIGGGELNDVAGLYSAILGGYDNSIASAANYSYLFGIQSTLNADSTFMVDMPHIRFGDETTGFEFPTADGSAGQVLQTDGAGQLTWATVSGGGGGWTDDGTVIRLDASTDSVGIGTATPSAKLDVSGDMIVSDKATIGPNHINAATNGFVAGSYNVARGAYSVVGGGGGPAASDSNAALGNRSVIGGGRVNIASGGHSTVGGGYFNQATGDSATIGGGFNNTALQAGTIAGGGNNSIINPFGTIGGGNSNTSNWMCFVGGGQANSAGGFYATIGGGGWNSASSDSTTVAGGAHNTASGTGATVGGGSGNTASDNYASVSGGKDNTASRDYSAIGGGSGNTTDGGQISAQYITIGGGENNTANEWGATIGGGSDNMATQFNATVPGGKWNGAYGYYSFAAGFNAKAKDDGSIVLAANDSQTQSDSVYTNGNEQMVLRADGGIYVTNTGGLAAAVDPTKLINTVTGAYLSSGGTWTNSSDRDKKENFVAIDKQELLDKVAALDITRWNYKTESDDITHIGPCAQDFYAQFRVGNDDRTIASVDESGVALAAIQGLYAKVQSLESENESLRTELASLRKDSKSIITSKSRRIVELEDRLAQLEAAVDLILSDRESSTSADDNLAVTQ